MDGTTATSPPSPGKADALARVAGRPDLLVAAGVVAVAAFAWWDLVRQADGCGHIAAPWHLGDLRLMAVMWTVMMVAMMLPTAAPMTVIFARIQRHRRGSGGAATPVALFVAGYVVAWTVWSVLAAVLQWAFQSTLLMSHHLVLESAWLAGAFVIVAGVYQLTPYKAACLVHCQSPIGFFMTRWREGWAGAFGMGARHGAYCIGCCWALMGLLFVVGVMNFAWIIVLTGYVLVEKLVPWAAASRAVGVGLVVWGVWLVAS